MATALLTLALAGLEHAHKIEVIIEQKAAAEAEARANAVTPELKATIEQMTAKLASLRATYETPDAATSGGTAAPVSSAAPVV